MLRRVSGLSSLGEVEVLSAEQCVAVTDAVLDAREDWTSRSPSGRFFTLGVNAYMDLAWAADADASYFNSARGANLLLKQRFAGVHRALAQVLEQALGLPTRYADDLAMPGFHIWVGLGIPSRASCTYPDDLPRMPAIRQTAPEVVPYHLGSALVHSGHVLHQIGATPSVQPDDLRITLQGHGLVVDDELVLYW
jgi:hypothetical protein